MMGNPVVTQRRTLRTLPVEDVIPWPGNPKARTSRNRQYIELTEHIKRYGQLDPIDVAEADQVPYQIVRGHRRYQIIRHELQWPFIEAWVWFDPFDSILPMLVQTERMQRSWSGIDKGQATLSLGVEAVGGLYRDEDYLLLQWAAKELAADPEVFRWLCGRFGPRVFSKVRPCVNEDWSVLRICQAIVRNGHYRDIEAKGLDVHDRQAILAAWEVA